MEYIDGKKTTPRTIKSEAIRKRIMEVGFQMIREYGMANVGIRDIAKEAGVSTGTLYYYFESKEALIFQHSLGRGGRIEAYAERLTGTTNCEKLIDFLVNGMAEVIEDDGPELIIWILLRKSSFKTLEKITQNLVCAAINAGELRNEKRPEEYVEFFLDAYRGATFAWHRSDGRKDIRELLREHVTAAVSFYMSAH